MGEGPKTETATKEPQIEVVGGVHGWLLKKAGAFMWDATSNKLVLPKGVVLTKEEKKALEDVIGEIQDEAEEVDKHRRLQMEALSQFGVKHKATVVKGYTLLFSGSYRELTGILAHKIHDNLQGMLQVNMRFLSGVWKAIAGNSNVVTPEQKVSINLVKGRDGR